jgi:hypothetical protein
MKIRHKTNLRKTLVSRVIIILYVAALFGGMISIFLPKPASADTTAGFRYTDARYSAITGKMTDTDTLTFRKTSGTNYDGGTPSFLGCHATIKTNGVGSPGGTLTVSSCTSGSGSESSRGISISMTKTYSGQWFDHGHISVDGVTYVDSHFDDNDDYRAVGQNNGCDANVIDGFPGKGGDPKNATATATITINEPVSDANKNCVSTQFPIRFTNTANYSDYFVWLDSSTIRTADGTAMTFDQQGSSGRFLDNGSGRSSDSKCLSEIKPDPKDPTHGTLILRNSDGNPFPTGFSPQISGADMHDIGSGCQASKPMTVNISNPNKANEKAPGTGAGNNENDDAQIGCEFSVNPLSWVVCPAVEMMSAAIEATDNIITQTMVLPAQDIFCLNSSGKNDTCDAYYTAWASFRNIALGLIVIAGLVVIIAQAIGMEVLDAYTLRKTLPRILVAAIAITLSWPLMNFAVTLSNNLGFGIRDLIVAPFHSLDGNINLNFGGGGGFTGGLLNFFGGGGALIVGGASIWMAAGGLGIILSYVATAGLAVLVAITVLILREIAVIMLILFAPIAIVAYILPNTQRVFRLWWQSFTRALLMFPMIAAFIAAGRVFAAISLSSDGSGIGGIFHGLIGFVAYFAPYFLIPLTFQFSGSVMSGLGNFVQQRTQGGFNALGNIRQSQRQSRIARERSTGLYRPGLGEFNYRLPFDKRRGKDKRTGSVAGIMNTMGFYTANADEMIPIKLGTTRFGGLKKGEAGIPLFRGGAQTYLSKIDRARYNQTAKAMQTIRPGYKAGRILGGMPQGEEHDLLSGLSPAKRAEFDDAFGIRGADGSFKTYSEGPLAGKTMYRAPKGDAQQKLAGDILLTSSDTEAREAGARTKAAAAELRGTNYSAETNYTDSALLGLMTAAEEGRLTQQDIVAHQKAMVESGERFDKAHNEAMLLQDLGSHKRPSMATGHGQVHDEEGYMHSTYDDPTSKKAMTSIQRQSTDDWRGIKAEDFTGGHGEAWVYGISDYQMDFDPVDGKVKRRGTASGTVLGPNGKPLGSDEHLKSFDERQDAKHRRDKFISMALYKSGDSGLQKEFHRIWREAGLPPEQLDRELASALARERAGAPPDEPAPQQPPDEG